MFAFHENTWLKHNTCYYTCFNINTHMPANKRALFRSPKKGQRSQWSHLQRTTNVVHKIMVEDLLMMLHIKYESSGPCCFRQDFLKLHIKILFFDPMTYLFNYWTILVGDHPGTIPVEFGQRPISGSREDVVWTFPYIIQC